jgi:hypothetical protein
MLDMQLLGPQFNTNGSGKRKLTAKQDQARMEHEAWLKRNGVHPTQLQGQKRGKLKKLFSAPVEKLAEGNFQAAGNTGAKKEEKQYTGKNLIGIAVMHKSCLQPIFTKESAKDSANMRR